MLARNRTGCFSGSVFDFQFGFNSLPRLQSLLGRRCDLTISLELCSPFHLSPFASRLTPAINFKRCAESAKCLHPLSGGEHTETFTRSQCCRCILLSVWSHTPAYADTPDCILPLLNGQNALKNAGGVLARLYSHLPRDGRSHDPSTRF